MRFSWSVTLPTPRQRVNYNTSAPITVLNITVLRVDCERLWHSAFRREADGKEASLAHAHLDKVYAEGDGQAS